MCTVLLSWVLLRGYVRTFISMNECTQCIYQHTCVGVVHKLLCLESAVDVLRVIASEIPTPVHVDMTAGFNTRLIPKAYNDAWVGTYEIFKENFIKQVRYNK